MHALDAGLAVNAASGALMMTLGALVAGVRGGGWQNRGFALFAVSFGAAWIVENLWGGSALHDMVAPVGVLLTVSAAGLAVVAYASGGGGGRGPRRHALVGAAVAGLAFVASFAFYVGLGGWSFLEARPLFVNWLGFWAFHSAAWGALAFLALRYRGVRDARPSDAARIRLMTVALVLYPAFYLARDTVAFLALQGWPRLGSIVAPSLILVHVVGLAALWLRNASGSSRASDERAVAWVVLAAALVGIPSAGFEANHPGYGIARTLGVAILAYAIVRHQLLGIDVKVRWTISKSTVAATFVTVFFVTAEGAQQFFGETLGGTYVGIAAAGALVFAMAPLQRAAERLAERAVPVAAPVPTKVTGPPTLELYRTAVRHALRDRAVTRAEERYLAELAERLDIGAATALSVREDVEREIAPEEAAP